jgi:hypothetical protein
MIKQKQGVLFYKKEPKNFYQFKARGQRFLLLFAKRSAFLPALFPGRP